MRSPHWIPARAGMTELGGAGPPASRVTPAKAGVHRERGDPVGRNECRRIGGIPMPHHAAGRSVDSGLRRNDGEGEAPAEIGALHQPAPS